MIEIKNKRMLLFPEDRIIGVQGDINTAKRKFVLDRVQDGYDLSDFVAWLKLEPSNGEESYSQLLKKEIVGERIVLTWLLSGANLKNEGELTAQVVLASPDYFNEDDLKNIPDDCLVVPSVVSGVSAPVWQSHKETFVVNDSIDDTAAYDEVTKNVLVSALASMAQNVEKTQEVYEQCEGINTAVNMMYDSVCESADYVERLRSTAEASAISAYESKQQVDTLCKAVEENATSAAESATVAAESAAVAAEKEHRATLSAEYSNDYLNECIDNYNKCYDVYTDTRNLLEQQKLNEDYKLIFSKTLTDEDVGCVAFEIDGDTNGEPLNLREYCFFVHIPAIPEVKSAYLRLEAKCDDGSFTRMAQFAGISRNADAYLRIEAKNMGRWTTKYLKSTSWFQNADSVYVGGTLCPNSRLSDGKKIKAVRIVQISDTIVDFPVGTMVELWGINSPDIEEGADE